MSSDGCLSLSDDPARLITAIGEGGGGSITPSALSYVGILNDNDRNGMEGRPANVVLDMCEGSEFRLDDLLPISGGRHTTCFRLRISKS